MFSASRHPIEPQNHTAGLSASRILSLMLFKLFPTPLFLQVLTRRLGRGDGVRMYVRVIRVRSGNNATISVLSTSIIVERVRSHEQEEEREATAIYVRIELGRVQQFSSQRVLHHRQRAPISKRDRSLRYRKWRHSTIIPAVRPDIWCSERLITGLWSSRVAFDGTVFHFIFLMNFPNFYRINV